jgi:hypothetical protein
MRFLDFNNNGKYDWWEYIVTILVILLIEILAELAALWICNISFFD